MKSIPNIFLIGPMGVGKTTIGRKLAHKTGRMFYDSDAELEKQTGATVNLIFELEGEEGFRKRERRLLSKLTMLSNIVLATGGGAVLDKENRKNLASKGVVVYLRIGIEVLLDRTLKDTKRPLLQTQNTELTLQKILQEREPLYCEMADFIIDAQGLSIDGATSKITTALSEQ